eukprot:Anaeramoba_ignava/a608336_230.p1 GENE.a608336_230~~a608336_230.p1  ORF type:complete len:339 (-),score=90.71 a608336_230:164-1180(-)
MSHSSGIGASKGLVQSFGQARNERIKRVIKIRIENMELAEVGNRDIENDEESDFALIHEEIKDNKACYILYRLDTVNKTFGDEWVFVVFVPSGSTVKDRMLYASTRDSCKKSLGGGYFMTEIYATEPNDISWDSILERRSNETYESLPYTDAELQQKEERLAEVVDSKTRSYVHSVAFPISSDSSENLKKLLNKSINFVQLQVDTSQETIELLDAGDVSLNDLPNKVNDAHPSYIFFRFKHQNKGKSEDPIIFFFWCPDTAKVKEKMLYSTVKSASLNQAGDVGVVTKKNIEIRDLEDFNESFFIAELYPPEKTVVKEKKFQKPARAGKGKARLVGRK